MRGCAEATEKRPNTWINDEIVRLYAALFARGAAHSVESWHERRAGRRALRRLARRRLFRRKHVQPRHRREQGRARASGRAAAARRLPPARHPVPDAASRALRRRSRSPARRYHRLLAEALAYRASFPAVLPEAAARRPARRLAIEQIDVVDRMLERRQRRARREHPAAEHAVSPCLRPAGSRRSRQRPRSPASPPAGFFSQSRTRIDKRAEPHRRADRRLEFRDARGDLVEPLQQRHRLRVISAAAGSAARCQQPPHEQLPSPTSASRWVPSPACGRGLDLAPLAARERVRAARR